MEEISYYEKLQDPRWQKIRLRVFERDNWTCRYCGSNKEQLQIHHTYYNKEYEPWDYNDDHLITLCKSCHQDETDTRYDNERALLKALKVAGFNTNDIDNLTQCFKQYNISNGFENPGSFIFIMEQIAMFTSPATLSPLQTIVNAIEAKALSGGLNV